MRWTLVSVLLRTTCAQTDRETVKLHVQPTVVILSMRVDETIEQYFDPYGNSRGSVNGDGKDLICHLTHQLTLHLL